MLAHRDIPGAGRSQPPLPVPDRVMMGDPKTRERLEHLDLGTQDAMKNDNIVGPVLSEEIPFVGEIDDVVHDFPVPEEIWIESHDHHPRNIGGALPFESADLREPECLPGR